MKNQESSGDFNGHHEAQKRKWPYSETNSFAAYTVDKGVAAKKSMTTYNYDNFQSNHQYIISTNPSNNGHELRRTSIDTTINCNQQTTQLQTTQLQTTQLLNAMEITENIEYVNILYEDDLLTSIQAPVATESNYINFEPNWGNADILDLDQRNYYYDATNTSTVHLSELNAQLSQQTEPEASIHIQQHQQMTQNDTQTNHQILEHTTNNNTQTVTEYEVIQNVYADNENGRDKSATSLREYYN